MTTRESDQARRVREAPFNYALLKLIHHEFGNGLAVLSGYRCLLQKAISEQAPERFPPIRDVWQYRNERCLDYLQAMQGREWRLNNLLSQLRELSSVCPGEALCQSLVRTDLVALLGRLIEQRITLCPDCVVQVTMPNQPLFIMCDPFWLQVLFEHVIFNYILVVNPTVIPGEIRLEPSPNRTGRGAKLTLRIRSDLPGLTPGGEGTLCTQIRVLEQEGEVEACIALCHEILHEHGGQILSEQEGSISLIFPMVE